MREGGDSATRSSAFIRLRPVATSNGCFSKVVTLSKQWVYAHVADLASKLGVKLQARRINRVSALSTVDGRVIAYHGGDG